MGDLYCICVWNCI